jgi:hypothetical protein
MVETAVVEAISRVAENPNHPHYPKSAPSHDSPDFVS